jgi:dienelactone hydrolase
VPLLESEDSLAGAPALVVSDGPPVEAAPRGCVLVLHGLGGHKGVQRPELERLASVGFVAVGLDAVGHGARRWPDFEERFRGDGGSGRAFRQLLRESVAEIPAVVDALVERGWGLPGRLGLAGVSLGGFVAYGGALAERRLGAAVAILGSPDWGPDAIESPHHAPGRFFPLPLLSLTAGGDDVVPPAPVHALHAALAPIYASAPDRHRHVEWPESGHEMRPSDWAAAWDEAIGWFGRFLRPGD